MLRKASAKNVIAACGLALLLAACSSDDKPAYVERPVSELYNSAQDLLDAKEYQKSAEAFDEVERQHPYSVWATKATLMSAYAYYQDNKYDDAITALDRFISLHPANPDVPYAYYLKALSYYEQISDVGRDQQMTQHAMDSLDDVIRRFPDSQYARDAKLKKDLTVDHLAGKEMSVGRYYQDRGEYLAAINRFKMVLDKYQTTTHVPEALARLTESYLALGLEGEAKRTASVLGHNFPGSPWYEESYDLLVGDGLNTREGESWWHSTTTALGDWF
ncbi:MULTISPECIES: outer membrane protein assembly factor BamD [Thalassospira]|uniref:Outer membrane protein assembly factor BamD n=1 Tax=Thalassospira permensis NBRC 106175 TaxID=1353532 RepID=A0ABR4TIV1_9PROT|nr:MULTISPECIES: outer membrane protein assembly factor BamD [Thalassospira]MBL4840651.1 outer membrane protein assembly factor BamD [Thalassospira sp.]MBR9778360.1 outer membrane protein assembly factor BamD [Rhodospirillales bacterium]KEO52059.1 ComL family lipoprotein [Thalassospira permensis NBRC 106175]MBR9815642.1 outer membrane protein assembly factor BamD [Rhodospirillales bacterium]PXX30771.1 outer membrane protein assembly factor BamD [Thalassospira sp. 11-3]